MPDTQNPRSTNGQEFAVFERWGTYHSVTVGELRDALVDLDSDLILVPNEVRNLAVLKHDAMPLSFIGYIDLGNKAEVVLDA